MIKNCRKLWISDETSLSASCSKSIRLTEAESGVSWSRTSRWKIGFDPVYLCAERRRLQILSYCRRKTQPNPRQRISEVLRNMGWSQNYLAKKCIPDLLRILTMWFAKLAKNYLLIEISWRFQTEWRSLSLKRSSPRRKRTNPVCIKF